MLGFGEMALLPRAEMKTVIPTFKGNLTHLKNKGKKEIDSLKVLLIRRET